VGVNFDKPRIIAVKNITMKKQFSLILLFITYTSFSQGWQWRNSEAQSNILKDLNNALYIFANTSNGISIKKRNLSGNILWTKSVTGGISANAYKVDAANNLVLIGNITTTATVDNYTLSSQSTSNFFILKFSSSSAVLSANVYGGSSETVANDIYINANGEYLIGGGYRGNFSVNGTLITGDTLFNFLILKTDPNQNVLWWEKSGYVSGAEGWTSINEIVETSSGNICAVYSTTGLVDFKGQQNVYDGKFMVQLDAARNFLWTTYLGYCWMWYESYYDLQAIGDTVYMEYIARSNHGPNDSYIVRWTVANVSSSKYMGNLEYFGYNVYGNIIYFAAICPNTAYPSTTTWYRHIGFLNSDLSNGLSDSTVTSQNYYSDMQCVDSSHFYIGGTDSTLGTFVGLFGINYSTLGINEIVQSENIIFPNPSIGIVRVDKNVRVTSAKAYNSSGREVECFLKDSEIDFGTQPKGIYFIDLLIENKRLTKKIILE
jgi:hypothetical protein